MTLPLHFFFVIQHCTLRLKILDVKKFVWRAV